MIIIKVQITQDASEIIQEQRTSDKKAGDLVMAIYRYTTRSWSRTYCQDMVQLVRKDQVVEHDGFQKYDNGDGEKDMDIEIYIDKQLMSEVNSYDAPLVIDKKSWSRWGSPQKSLCLKIGN